MTEISEEERQKRIELTENNPWYKLAVEGRDIWNSFIIKAYYQVIEKAYPKANFPPEIINLISPILSDVDFEHFKNETGITDNDIKKYPKFIDGYFADSSHNFKGFIFPSVNFQNCIFDIDFHAEGAFFLNGAGFGNAKFRGDTTFNNCYFEEANFCLAKFFRDNFFENARFYGRTEFCETFHRSQLLFKNVTAHDDIEFDRAVFQSGVFDDCKFLKSARFRNTEFNNIRMMDTAIEKNCSFFDAKFLGITQFNKTAFQGFADFRKTKFSAQGNRVINQVNIDRIGLEEISPSFIGTDFKEGVDFQNAVFDSPPHFEGAKCEIILLDNTTIKNPPKPHKDILHIYASAWAALIRLMEKVHNLPKRQEFHERLLEVESLYKTEKRSWLLYKAYNIMGKGRSVLMPLILLLGFIFYFQAWNYQAMKNNSKCENSKFSCSIEALGISVANTLPFLPFSRQMISEHFDSKSYSQNSGNTDQNTAKGLIIIGGTIQNLLSIFFLFFIGLALRNRFKLK